MRILIELLQPTPVPEEKLRADGWEIESEGGSVFVAWHPNVADEEEARERLGRMGLLTASDVRIAFLLPESGRPGAGGSPPGAGPPP
jgi:hypothetical protein